MPIVQIPTMQARLKNGKLSRMALRRIGLDADKTVRKVFKASSLEITKEMQEPGKAITYPVKWDSEKQRRYVMWLLRSTNNLPWVRRGNYVANWKQKTIRGGYQVSNMLKFAGYIAGDIKGLRQSRIHKGRWKVFFKVVNRVLKKVPKQVVSDLRITFKRLGFRVQ